MTNPTQSAAPRCAVPLGAAGAGVEDVGGGVYESSSACAL